MLPQVDTTDAPGASREICGPDISAPGELLYGVVAIAGFLGVTPRVAQSLISKSVIPYWRTGRIVCARRTGLRDWMLQQERKAVALRAAK